MRFRVGRRLSRSALIPAAALLAGCSGSPFGPSEGSKARRPLAGSATVASMPGTVQAANEPPDVVFRTRPRADVLDRIFGDAPLEVFFNMCPTRDAEEDDMKYKYDYEGDGVFERTGHCRGSYVYREVGCRTATVCADDKPGDEWTCRSYEVCTGRPETSTGGGAGLPGVPTLQLFLWNGESSGNGTDSFTVRVDGTSVFNVIAGNPAYSGGYAAVNLDLTPFAGGAHTLSLESTTTGLSNFSVDDVFIGCGGGANGVTDPSFEAGSPSSFWGESSTNLGTPLCTLAGCGDGSGTVGPRTGTWWAWFGGFGEGTEVGMLVQAAINVPSCQ